MLKKPAITVRIIPKEKIPPVKVWYCASSLYLSISEEENMSIFDTVVRIFYRRNIINIIIPKSK
jgi:hypothetical protein